MAARNGIELTDATSNRKGVQANIFRRVERKRPYVGMTNQETLLKLLEA